MTEHRTPSLAGSSGQDSPRLTGWGIAAYQDDQETQVSDKDGLYKVLRDLYEPPRIDDFGCPIEAKKSFYFAMGEWINKDAHGFWMEPESEDGHCDPVMVAFAIASRFSELSSAYNGSPTQSPIEDMMLGALLWMHLDWVHFPEFDALGSGPAAYADGTYGDNYYITTQAPIAGHKADFLIWVSYGKSVGGIVVECDGHDFHEKTKEQAARDKKRDREMLAAGFPVVRFSGSEVFKDVQGCVEQIKKLMLEVLFRVSKDGGRF